MSELELFEATRGIWKVGPKRDRVDWVFSVFQGVVMEVYRVERWVPAGTLNYETRDKRRLKRAGRWEFEGEVAEESVRKRYVGKRVPMTGRNPIRYVNV